MKFESSAIIDDLTVKGWEFMADLGNMAKWDPFDFKVEWQGPTKVGGVAQVTARGFGMQNG